MIFYSRNNFIEFFRQSLKFQALNAPHVEWHDPVDKKTISVCTTCMNRLHDLRRTLPKNLDESQSYSNAEFVLLDYGSSDGLEDWTMKNLANHLDSGRLRYCRVEALYFQPNHSRNVSFRLAKGDLVVNVDSDNFMHNNFLERLNQCATVATEKLLIVPEIFLLPNNRRFNLQGRFAVYRKDIERLHGFDEDLDEGFSHDDVSFVLRAMLDRFQIVRFEKSFVENRIATSDGDRVKYVKNPNFQNTKLVNETIISQKLGRGKIQVNEDGWGRAKVREVSASTERYFQI